MDGRRKPEPKPENENALIDEEIIDLTQVAEGGDDDEIIDLNDILEQPDQAADETDEVVIPLVDAIPAEETAVLPEDTDDEIIDLEDVATTLDASISEMEPGDYPLPAEKTASVAQDDEAIIDLEDMATSLDADTTETEPVAEADGDVIDLLDVTAFDTPEDAVVAPPSSDRKTEVIDLTDIEAPVPTVSNDEELSDLESRAEAMLTDTAEATVESVRDPSDVETPGPDTDGMVLNETEDNKGVPAGVVDGDTLLPEETAMLEPKSDALQTAAVPFPSAIPPEAPAVESIPVTSEQVESALERVIEKIYGEKIEQMMIQTIEKTVKREIEKIKTALIEESDGMVR